MKALYLAAIVLLGLTDPVVAYKPAKLTVGFSPWENPAEISKIAAEVTKLLGKELSMTVVPKVASDYAGVVEAMRNGQVDIAFFPPAAYVLAEQRAKARVILKSMFKGQSAYYSAIITRKDSGISKLADLKGKTFAFVDPNSTSGSIYPRVMLLDAGIKPERDFAHVIQAGGHDVVVLSVLNRKVDAGACYANDAKGAEAAWTNPQLVPNAADRAMIKVVAFSRPIPSDNIAVRSDLDADLVMKVRKFFLKMSSTPEGRQRIRKVFRVDGFTEAMPADYEPVRDAFRKVGFKIP